MATGRLAFELDLMFPARLPMSTEMLTYWQRSFEEARLTEEQLQALPAKVRQSGAEHPPSVPALIQMARPPRRINAAAYRNEPLALPPAINRGLGRTALDAAKKILKGAEHGE